MIGVNVAGPYTVLIDPCHGERGEEQLSILVHGVTVRDVKQATYAEIVRAHIGWPDAYLLSIDRAKKFIEGVQKAIDVAEEMEKRQGYHRFTEKGRHLYVVGAER